MKTDVIKTYRTVHTWVGITSALFLFIAFYAGALAVFEPLINRWVSPAAEATLTPLSRVDQLIAQTVAEVPASRRHLSVHLDPDSTLSARLTWQEGTREEPHLKGAALGEDGTLRTFDITGGPIGDFIDHLHRTGGLPLDAETGALIMGLISAAYFVALVSGLMVLLPSLIKDLFAVRVGKNLKRMWLDAHNVVGLFSLPFHVVIALTSVAFGLHDEIYGALDKAVYGGELRQEFVRENPYAAVPHNPAAAPLMTASDILHRVDEVAPGFVPSRLDISGAGTAGASVAVWGHDDRYLMRGQGFLVLNGVTGAVANTDYMPGQQGIYGAILSSFFALHMASFGGETVKWGYLALGLAGAFLFYSGNLLWIESRRRREKRLTGPVTQRRAAHWMAALTVGICVGTVGGLSAVITAAKWLFAWGVDAPLWFTPLFYCVFVACVLWALLRGAARAGAPLLKVSALLTLSLPLTSLLGWAFPALGLKVWSDSLSLDGLALVGALGLWRLAQSTRRRALQGPRDSVWRIPDPASAKETDDEGTGRSMTDRVTSQISS